MIIHLDNDIFYIVKEGTKHIEVRLYDEKRRQLNIGDKLIFLKRPEDILKINTIIKDLKVYSNFDELVKNYDIKDMYLENLTKEEFIKLLERFYTKEDQEKYGVLAIDFEIQEKSCGAVVFNDNSEILLIKSNKGHWGIPKGHVEDNETEQETAIREVKEETNIDIEILDGFRNCISYSPKLNTNKEVVFFIGKAINNELINQESEVSIAKYFNIDEAMDIVTYENEKNIIKKVKEYINK